MNKSDNGIKSLYELNLKVFSSSSPSEAAGHLLNAMGKYAGKGPRIYLSSEGGSLKAACFMPESLANQMASFKIPARIIEECPSGALLSGQAPPELDNLFKALDTDDIYIFPAACRDKPAGFFILKKSLNLKYTARDISLFKLYGLWMAQYMHIYSQKERIKKNKAGINELKNMKNNFSSLISHELKTPLTLIKGFTQLLLEKKAGPLSRRQESFVQKIKDSASGLYLTIENIIASTENRSLGKVTEKEKINISELIKECCREYKKKFENKNIKCKIKSDTDIPPVNINKIKIKQAFGSLLDNAVKFSSPGGSIDVLVKGRGDFVQVSVIDSGKGIDKKAGEKVFESFYQCQQPKTRGIEGLGLGLSVAKSIIEKHGGKIEVGSAEKRGAELKFILPLKRVS